LEVGTKGGIDFSDWMRNGVFWDDFFEWNMEEEREAGFKG